MILIVDGSNRVGKSTLIKVIHEEFPNSVVFNERYVKNKEGHTSEVEMSSYFDGFTSALLSMEKENPEVLYILDRYHITELVYGQIFRNYNNIHMLDIDAMMVNAGAKMLFLYSDYEHIDDLEKKQEYKDIQTYFKVCLNGSEMDRQSYRFTKEIIESQEAMHIYALKIIDWVKGGDK